MGNKKGQISMTNVLMGLLVVALFSMGFMLLIGNVMTSYDVELEQDINEDYTSTSNDVIDLSKDMYQRFESNTTASKASGWDDLAVGSYNVLRLFLQSFGMIGKIVNAMAADLHIPAPFIAIFIGMITIVLVGIIVTAILRPPRGGV